MRVYLAAPYAARDKVRKYADELTRIGFKVTSTWLAEEHEINDGTTGADQVSAYAVQDFDDIRYSDLIVVFSAWSLGLDSAATTSGGRHVETGFALALDKPVIVVGEPENVFHRIKGGWSVDVVPTWHDAVVELSRRLVARERSLPQELVR